MEYKGHFLESFYGTEDVAVASSLFQTKDIHQIFEVIGLEVEFFPAGHILGAVSVRIKGEKTIVFSGDLGRSNDPILAAPGPCPAADIVVMESTYGGRIRRGVLEDELHEFLRKIKKECKVGIIASFSVARAQLLITLIHKFYDDHPEEKIRVVMDGPMMVEANNVYKQFAHDTKVPLLLKTALEEIEVIDQTRKWDSIKKKDGPLIVISSSGMVSGGRIWRYLENWQQDLNACLFLPGYQGAGTAGKLLSEGKRIIHDEEGTLIHWHGDIRTSEAFSSHADQNELISWLKNISLDTQIYLNHGEDEAKISLQHKLLEMGYKNVKLAGQN